MYHKARQNKCITGFREDTDRWNRIQCPERNLHTYGKLIFDKGAKTIQWGKEYFASGAETTGDPHAKKKTLGPLLHTIYKN